jgi:D-3-phosphoglycerate dehydrogenase
VTLRVAIGPSSFAEADAAPLACLRDAGVVVVPNPWGRRLTEDEILAHLDGVDGLIAGLEPLNRRVLTAAVPRLRAIARVGIGMDNVDQAAARDLGIRVSNTPDEPTVAVAELTVAALLAIVRELVPSNEALHRGEWRKLIGQGLGGATVLLVGYGRIGRRVGQLLRPFGVQLLVADPAVTAEDCRDGEELVPLMEGLSRADVVSLHAAGKAVVLDDASLQIVKPGAILLNSARAELVVETALCAALADGRIRAAWLDVFWEEPYGGPLTGYPQVLLTPHVGTYTRQCRRDMELAAVRHLLRDLGVA